MFRIIFWIVLLLNYFAINYCVFSGPRFEDISFLFQEHQAITFLSALQLGLTSFLALSIYILARIIYKKNIQRLRAAKIWVISAFVFAFSTIDEYFMLHEGIDGDIATTFFGITENPHLDGLTLSLYGLGALFIFLKFKEEITRYRNAFTLFCIGVIFFFFSAALDIKSIDSFCLILEESSKLIAVAFLFLGHISVFIENIKVLDKRINEDTSYENYPSKLHPTQFEELYRTVL